MTGEVLSIIVFKIQKSPLGNDHYPIRITSGIEVQQEEEQRIQRWKLDKADWDTFQAISKDRCEHILREDIVDGDEFNKMLVAAIKVSKRGNPKGCREQEEKECAMVGRKL